MFILYIENILWKLANGNCDGHTLFSIKDPLHFYFMFVFESCVHTKINRKDSRPECFFEQYTIVLDLNYFLTTTSLFRLFFRLSRVVQRLVSTCNRRYVCSLFSGIFGRGNLHILERINIKL